MSGVGFFAFANGFCGFAVAGYFDSECVFQGRLITPLPARNCLNGCPRQCWSRSGLWPAPARSGRSPRAPGSPPAAEPDHRRTGPRRSCRWGGPLCRFRQPGGPGLTPAALPLGTAFSHGGVLGYPSACRHVLGHPDVAADDCASAMVTRPRMVAPA